MGHTGRQHHYIRHIVRTTIILSGRVLRCSACPGTNSVPSTDDVGVVVDGAGAYVRVHDLQMNDVRCGIRQGRSGAEVGGYRFVAEAPQQSWICSQVTWLNCYLILYAVQSDPIRECWPHQQQQWRLLKQKHFTRPNFQTPPFPIDVWSGLVSGYSVPCCNSHITN